MFIWPCYNPNHTGGGLGRRENFETLTVAKYYHVRPTLKACNFKSIKAMDFKLGFFPYNCTANNLAYIIKINGLDFFLWSPYFDQHVFQIFYSVFILFLRNIIELYCSSIYLFGNFNFLYRSCIFVESFLRFSNVSLRILKFKMMAFQKCWRHFKVT